MKKKVWIFIFIFITTAFVFAEDITSLSYGKQIVYDSEVQKFDINIEVPLSFSLADAQSYEFGFTQDESVSLRTQTKSISTLPLSRDEEREGVSNNVIASASFKVYWKIISGYGLKFYLAADGPFKSKEDTTIAYSIYDIGDNIILGDKGNNSPNYSAPVEIGSFSPDYTNQDFSEAELVSLEIVTTDDLSAAFESSSSYSTILKITVEVTN